MAGILISVYSPLNNKSPGQNALPQKALSKIAADDILNFYVPGSNSGDILFLPCLFVGLFVGWTTLTLVITFELFEIEHSYLAYRFLVTKASH